jgi:inosine-uridine nucleoside N-ribohydrolase
MRRVLGLLAAAFLITAGPVHAQPAREKVIVDTDIGDDVDDAFAVALALASPEFEVLGFSADFGDTPERAKLLDRMLGELGRNDIPVAAGPEANANRDGFSQRPYADGGAFARRSHPGSVDFILGQARRYPGQVTLVAIGPLTNVGAMIDKDPAGFRQLKRVVMMGGSIGAGVAEWNIQHDVASAQKLFRSGVPIVMMPLDSTDNLKLDEAARNAFFGRGGRMTSILAELYGEWSGFTHTSTPTLFDPMTLAAMAEPSLCPLTPMHIEVDDAGRTRRTPGAANAEVCLRSDPHAFVRFYMERVGGR